MAKKIWKYKLNPELVGVGQLIEMPENSKILTVQLQGGIPCIWVQVNAEFNKIQKEIVIVGTGHQFPKSGLDYVGTYQYPKKKEVYHVFTH